MAQYQNTPFPAPRQDHPQTVTILVLGIVSIAVCQVCGPFAWKMGNTALAEIDASGGQLGGRDMVNIGRILGIVGTVFLILGLLFVIFYIVVIVLILGGAAMSST